MDGAVVFALPDVVFLACVVCQQAAACTRTAAKEAADYGAACSGAADDLGCGVVTGVGAVLLPRGAIVGLHLRERGKGQESKGGKKSEGGTAKGVHGIPW